MDSDSIKQASVMQSGSNSGSPLIIRGFKSLLKHIKQIRLHRDGYNEIREEWDDFVRESEQQLDLLFILIMWFFTDYIKDHTTIFNIIRLTLYQDYNYFIDTSHVWLLLFGFLYGIGICLYSIFYTVMDIIYRIRPDWY